MHGAAGSDVALGRASRRLSCLLEAPEVLVFSAAGDVCVLEFAGEAVQLPGNAVGVVATDLKTQAKKAIATP